MHIHSVIKSCGGALGPYFGKTGLALGIMKALKKHLNLRNRDLILAMVRELLTKQCSVSLRQDLHKFISSELANSKNSSERVIFIYLCQTLAPHVSKKYFAESFLETYVSLLAVERNQPVILAMIKTARNLRPQLEEA